MRDLRMQLPVADQVFQRSDASKADIPFTVEHSGGQHIEVALVGPDGGCVNCGVILDGGDEQSTGKLTGVPTGGPYTLRVSAGDGSAAEVSGLLVGDLWVLAGQSNMDGVGKLFDTEPPSDRVHAFYYDDRWGIAVDPLCWYDEATDPVHWQNPQARETAIVGARATRSAGAGLGVAFGKELDRLANVPIGLIVCSHGGTSLAQWSPDLRDQGGASLYGSMMRRIEAVGGSVKGVLWYQGESDASTEAAGCYAESFIKFVSAVRNDLGRPALPFLYVQLGCFYQWDAPADMTRAWHQVRTAQLACEPHIAPAAVVSAIDLSLHDAIHIDTAGLRRLGRRLATLANIVAYGADNHATTGPRPHAVEVSEDRTGVCIRFSGVNGRIISSGRWHGFTVLHDGTELLVKSCRVGPDGRCIEIVLFEPAPEGAELYYGWGLNPACGLVDEADIPVPVFGPLAL